MKLGVDGLLDASTSKKSESIPGSSKKIDPGSQLQRSPSITRFLKLSERHSSNKLTGCQPKGDSEKRPLGKPTSWLDLDDKLGEASEP